MHHHSPEEESVDITVLEHQQVHREEQVGQHNETALSAPDPASIGSVATRGQVEADSRERKARQAEHVAALQKQIAHEIEALVDAGAWQKMLAVASHFHDYSFGNQVLIAMQRPDATRVAGYRAWQKLGRQVRKGEQGIAILAPVTLSPKTNEDQQRPRSPEESAPTTGDAQAAKPSEDKPRIIQRFKVAHVFDISQTEGDPLPGVPERLIGDADQAVWDDLARLVEVKGYQLIRTDQGPDGYTSPTTHTVGVRADVDQAHAVMVLMHELAHIACGHAEEGFDYVAHRGTAEVEAQSVAFVVAAAKGLDTTAFTTDYVIGWAHGDMNLIRATAQKVTGVAHEVLEELHQ
jgi:antirestriction protein ArdC